MLSAEVNLLRFYLIVLGNLLEHKQCCRVYWYRKKSGLVNIEQKSDSNLMVKLLMIKWSRYFNPNNAYFCGLFSLPGLEVQVFSG